jgi:hypothetical protein
MNESKIYLIIALSQRPFSNFLLMNLSFIMITALLVVFIIIQDNNHVLKIDDLNMQTVLKAKEMFSH